MMNLPVRQKLLGLFVAFPSGKEFVSEILFKFFIEQDAKHVPDGFVASLFQMM